MTSLSSRLISLALVITLLFNTILPVSQNGVRTALLALSAVIALVALLLKPKYTLDRGYTIAFLACLVVGAFGVWIGLLNSNPGALFVSPLYLIFPLVYSLIFVGLEPRQHTSLIVRILFTALWVVPLLMIWHVLYHLGYIPFDIPFDFGQAYNPAIPQMRFYSISSLVFLLPFATIYLMTRAAQGHRDWLNAVPLFLGLIAAYLSGRRALMLVTLLVPPLIWAWYIFRKPRAMVASVVMLVYTGLAALLLFTYVPVMTNIVTPMMDKAVTYLTEEFVKGSGGEDEFVRAKQTELLLDSWHDSPLIGHGLGQAIAYTRNSDRIWQYESQYAMMLSNLGLVGMIVFGLSTLWIIVTLVRLSRLAPTYAPMCLGLMAGLLSFIFANYSNPYFQAFGHLWGIFLPAAYAAALKRELKDASSYNVNTVSDKGR